MRRLAVLWGACVLAMLLLAGCGSGGGGGDDNNSPNDNLPGSWRASRISLNGQSTACPGEVNSVENGEEVSVSCGANETVTFYEGGAVTGATAEAGAFAGTWQVNDNNLTINVTDPAAAAGEQLKGRLSFSGDNTFSLAIEDGGTLTFNRQ